MQNTLVVAQETADELKKQRKKAQVLLDENHRQMRGMNRCQNEAAACINRSRYCQQRRLRPKPTAMPQKVRNEANAEADKLRNDTEAEMNKLKADTQQFVNKMRIAAED